MIGTMILLPLQMGYDNRGLFSFAMEFSKRIHGEITTLTTYSIPLSSKYSSELHAEKVEYAKEQIHLGILELIGYYQCFYNRWKPEGKVKTNTLIKEGTIEEGIFSMLNENSSFLLLLNQEYFKDKLISPILLSKLVRSKIKILTVPQDNNNQLVNPYMVSENTDVAGEFDRMLMKTEIYNMPEDVNLFRCDVLKACC